MKKNILLTGNPGCGKTTLIKLVLSKLEGLKANGFFTSEIREKGTRKGFKIRSLDGREAILSHVDFKGTYRVSKYVVSLENLEEIGLKALGDAMGDADIIVIDEIGKMELFSEKVRKAILAALDSKKRVLGTIMMARNEFADGIKRRNDVEVIQLSKENWEGVKGRVVGFLE